MMLARPPEPGSEEIATQFLKATFEGRIFCRDNLDKCVEHVLALGTTLGKGHQAWQMSEVNPLIWPSPNGIGITDKALWDQTIAVALEGKDLELARRADLLIGRWRGAGQSIVRSGRLAKPSIETDISGIGQRPLMTPPGSAGV